jgi:phospholipase C
MHHFATQGAQARTLKPGLSKAMAIMAAAALTLTPMYPTFAKDRDDFPTKTPIKHVVVIFQENVSFDHYFGTYPHAFNLPGETPFHAKADTPESNTLLSSGLLTNNPNKANPFRIPPSVPVTCDEDHNYNDEQAAAHGGLMDRFVEKLSCNDPVLGPASTMGYYDGNTVTAMWNYAQHFAMSDNSWGRRLGRPLGSTEPDCGQHIPRDPGCEATERHADHSGRQYCGRGCGPDGNDGSGGRRSAAAEG